MKRMVWRLSRSRIVDRLRRMSRPFAFLRDRSRSLSRHCQERGITFIEIMIMSLVMTIALVAISHAIRVATQGVLAAKERSRALALARDRLEEVKNMGFVSIGDRFSSYRYPDHPDPLNQLQQEQNLPPYPDTPPTADEDPWTPEIILVGKINYWRHVVVKFVWEPTDGAPLEQKPKPNEVKGIVGGTNVGSRLAYIEVDVTWFSRRLGMMKQVRVSTLLADTRSSVATVGEISGTVLDDKGTTSYNSVFNPGPDDVPVTDETLVVTARNLATEAAFTAEIDGNGFYKIVKLPYGSYDIKVTGLPGYRTSAYTGYSCMPDAPTYPVWTASITAGMKIRENINIWTRKLALFDIHGRFIGVDGSATQKQIDVSCNDGVSNPVTVLVTTLCDAVTPCEFDLPGVAWPGEGMAKYEVVVHNVTDDKTAVAEICIDSQLTPANFVVGDDPSKAEYTGFNPCNLPSGCGVNFDDSCVDPADPWDPLDVSVAAAMASIEAQMRVHFNLSDGGNDPDPVLDLPFARIRLENLGSAQDDTLAADAAGKAVFSTAAGPAQQVKITAFMTTTGYTTDDYFLPFAVQPAVPYVMTELDPAEPPTESEHTFRIYRVSSISGSVWEMLGTAPYQDAKVVIKNTFGWSNVLTTDEYGHFYHGAVPVDINPYGISLLIGGDYAGTPSTPYSLTIDTHGIHYTTDSFGTGLEFVLTAVNGTVRGVVTKNGSPVGDGAVVIASTYDTAAGFVSPIPNPVLVDEKTYSTVTLTDGTYQMKVATGVGVYYLYTSFMWNGAQVTFKLGTTVTAIPNAETTADLAVP